VSSLTAAPSLREEPALGFWLSYAQRHGALVEEGRDSALVLLPEALQGQAELPEEVTVTASPELAREEAAALLIAGHPAVERAAESVLGEGDTGRAFLPWPGSRPPSRGELTARARELVGVEHGRIDPAGEPIAAYLPLLRVGAMVSYTASLTLRFHEQEHVLLDARTRLEPPRGLSALAARGRWLERADGHGRLLRANVPRTLAAAHALIEARVAAREAALAAHARRSLASELARAESYFERQLASLERRRASAPVDRARLLDDQTQATRAEWARRRREIEEEYRPRHEIRPFRLQLMYAPAFLLPVQVRRGSVTFPLELTWIPAAGEFAALRCPACGALEPLIASRQRLGCRSCA
jgi:hypothetical protein